MEIFFLVFLSLSFWAGQVVSLELGNGVRIIPLDLVVGLFGVWSIVKLNKPRFLSFWPALPAGRLVQNQTKNKDSGVVPRSGTPQNDLNIKYWQMFGWFVVIAIFSLVWQIGRFDFYQIAASSLYLVRFVFYSFLIVIFSQSRYVRWGYILLLVNGLGLATLGLFQLLLYPNLRNLSYLGWDSHQYRIFSTLLDPNFTGIILVLALFLGYWLLEQRKHKNVQLNKIVFWLLLGQTFLALLLTYSRGSYLAFLAGIFVWMLLKGKTKLFILTGALFIGLLFLLPKPGGEGVNLLRTISVEARWENNLEAVNLWRSSPLIGVGFNTLRFIRTEALSEDLARSGGGFHNSWLFLLATTGIIGFLTYLLVWQRIIKEKIKGKLFTEKNTLVLASLTAVAVHSFFDNSLFYPAVMFWVFILMGTINSEKNNPS